MTSKESTLESEASSQPALVTSQIPSLGEGFEVRRAGTQSQIEPHAEDARVDTKTGKRRFWGLGKKKEDEQTRKKGDAGTKFSTSSGTMPPPAATNVNYIRPSSPIGGLGHIPHLSGSPSHPCSLPSSPGRNNPRSYSPAPISPASSQIFERHVQEDSLAAAASPAIPAHITTENHIPPVLDASSQAITDDHLNPDEVEIVMHAAHQPAALTVTGASSNDTHGTSVDEHLAPLDSDENASTYGILDTTDVRRLSFISFADVVNAEHADHGGSIAGLAISPVPPHANRSPSPARSPLSSQALGGSPVLSSSASSKGLETSPNRVLKGLASPLPSHSPPATGELTIETMRQALRKTGSGDLGGARSNPVSALGGEDGNIDSPLK